MFDPGRVLVFSELTCWTSQKQSAKEEAAAEESKAVTAGVKWQPFVDSFPTRQKPLSDRECTGKKN